MSDHNIPAKTNRVLNVIILGMLLILVRVWYLAVVQHDEYVELARRPQRRTVVERVERATIRDRFNLPLAVNKIQYNAAVRYADLRQIPSVTWKKDETGKSVRTQARSVYIRELSVVLADLLGLDPKRIEDTIHGKASLFPHTPFVLKEDISEEQYYRLRMLEKQWLGIETQRSSTRVYPLGRCGSDVIGYMGQISGREYSQVAQELKNLQNYVAEREAGEMPILPKGFDNPLQVRERLKVLQEKSYTVNDLVGKTGIESGLDEKLRGFFGKKVFEVDTKGNFLRELPGSRPPVAGQRVLLSISAELQEYAEALLAQNETFREVKDADGKPSAERPWIKGGSIVALDPRSGEVLALASYPRLDPNDFISVCNPEIKKKRQASVLRWLENEAYIGELWDGKRPLERELFSFADNAFYEEALPMDWKRYLATILPPKSALYQTMLRIQDVRTAVRIQQEIETLLELSGQENLQALITSLYPAEEGYTPFRQPVGTDLKKEIRTQLSAQAQAVLSAKTYLDVFLRPISYNNDQLLVIDLCRLLVNKEGISEELLQEVGKESIASFRSRCQAAAAVKSSLRKLAQEWFHEIDFQTWRDAHFKEFLKKKRLEEKEKKQYARPYTEYLELLEKNMFKEFWQSHCHAFLQVFLIPGTASFEKPYLERLLRVHAVELEASANTLRAHLATLPSEIVPSYLRMLRSFEDLNRPLLGRYRSLRHTGGVQQEKHLAASFYPLAGFGYGRSQAFRQSSPQGSVFKVVTSYAALLERYRWLIDNQRSLSEMNPLTLIDDLQWNKPGTNQQILGYTLDGTPITRLYKGGRLPRSSHPHIGKIDLLGALEQSSNLYFAMLSSDHIQEPNALAHIAHLFGFGERSGIDLPGETAGEVPDDLGHNRTGLYAFAMGQHSLVVTPLQSALMLAAIANHGKVLKPKIVQLIAGKAPARKTQNLFCRTEFPLQDDLALIGISFPLFTSTLKDTGESTVSQSPTEVRRILLLPDELRDQLLEGMHRVVCGTRGTARAHIIRSLYENAQVMRDYLDLQNQIVGKTGTAEILYKQTIDAESQAEIVNHIWFACISFASPIDQSKERSSWPDPELIVVVLLRFGKAGGREAAPLATQMIKKWREICAKHGRSAHIVPLPESSGLFSSGPH